MIAPTPFFADRGCHMHIAEQARAFQRLGHRVLITTYGLGRDLPDLETRRTWRSPWYRKLGPGPSWHKFYMDPLLLWSSYQAARRFRPHILHAHLHEGVALGFLLRHLLHTPLIFDCQGSLTGELLAHRFPLTKMLPLRRIWLAFERWLDHRADVVVVQSTEMFNEITKTFRVPAGRVRMACDGVDVHSFRPQQVQDLRRKLNIPPSARIIVYLGGLHPSKGVDIVLEAFPHVLKEIPEAFLLLMGYPNEERYRKRAKALGVAPRVRVTGRIPYEKAPRYLALGDIAVAPKRGQTEANGKIYNYMACGLPVVAFDTIMNREILGELGVYIKPPGDAKGLADVMINLLKNEQQRRFLAQKVRAHAVAHYSWDKVAARLLKAYRKAWEIYHQKNAKDSLGKTTPSRNRTPA